MRTGSSKLLRNWAGYCRLAAWDVVMALSMSGVCDLVRRSIGPRYVALSPLGGGGSMVCGTLGLVRRATGSYCSLVDVTLGADRATLGSWMITLGSKAWGCTFS